MPDTPTVQAVQKKALPNKKVVHKNTRKVRFKVKACPDSVVYIAGTFNQWDPAVNRMEPADDGFYIADLVLPAGRNEYKFLIDGVWHLDPTCSYCVPNAFGSLNHFIEV